MNKNKVSKNFFFGGGESPPQNGPAGNPVHHILFPDIERKVQYLKQLQRNK